MTRAPTCLAIWTPAMPTPEPAAWTSAVSPARRAAFFTKANQAVMNTTGMPAASSKLSDWGMGTTAWAIGAASSAYPPDGMSATTRSPSRTC